MTQDSKTSDSPELAIRQTCLRLLAMREHSQLELRKKLQTRGYSHEAIQDVLLDLCQRGWQSDLRFAEAFARQRLQKGYGPIKVRFELQQKGIRDFELDQFAEQESGGWQDCLLAVYQRKYDNKIDLSQTEWLKRSRFLQQRGFSQGMIRQLAAELRLKLGSRPDYN